MACSACGRERGYVAASILYGPEVPDDARFCPWCIADGTAHSRFGGTFNEVDAGAAPEIDDEVSQRTPGIPAWQDWYWPTHCEDAGVYLGQPTGEELRANSAAYEQLLEEIGQYDWGRDEEQVRQFVDGLGGSQVVYLFECPRCGAQLVKWDAD